MKSAIEIALEKTRDIQPAEDPHALTPEQKERVRALNKEFDVKIAEMDTNFNSRLRAMRENHDEQEIMQHVEQFLQELRREKDTINAERANRMEELLKSFGK